jgi:hypothetical protein
LADAIDAAVELCDQAGAGSGILLAGSVALAGQARAMLAGRGEGVGHLRR